MWMILFFVLSLLFVQSAEAQTETPVIQTSPPVASETHPASAPESPIRIEPETFDFGVVYFSSPVTHDFTVTNISQSPITITDIKPDCGCTAVMMNVKELQPGQAGILNVIYKPEQRVGKTIKKITVYTSPDTERNWVELPISADVHSILTITPSQTYFRNVHVGDESSSDVSIRADADQSIDILGVECVEGRMNLELSSPAINEIASSTGTASGSKEWKLTLRLPKDLPIGRFESKIKIRTNSPVQPEYIFSAVGVVLGPLSVNPTQWYLGTLKPNDEQTKTFKLTTSRSDQTLQTPDVTSAIPGLTWSIEPGQSANEFLLKMKLVVPADHKGRLSGEITIHTHDSAQPEFSIPVFGYIPEKI